MDFVWAADRHAQKANHFRGFVISSPYYISIIHEIKSFEWNIRCLVDDLFVPSSKQPSAIYCRLTDFKSLMTTLVIWRVSYWWWFYYYGSIRECTLFDLYRYLPRRIGTGSCTSIHRQTMSCDPACALALALVWCGVTGVHATSSDQVGH